MRSDSDLTASLVNHGALSANGEATWAGVEETDTVADQWQARNCSGLNGETG